MAKHWRRLQVCAAIAALTAIATACGNEGSGGSAGGGEVVDEGGNLGDGTDGSGGSDTTADTATDTVPDTAADTSGTGCPASAPIGTADVCEGAKTCSYGQECCCGQCHPSVVCTCQGGKFACLYTDACLLPPDACPSDTSDDTAVDATDGAGDTAQPDTAQPDAATDASDAGVPWGQIGDPCNEVMSSIMPCAKGLYCAREVGACTGMGVCAQKPEACDMMYQPVCGCDGKTHGNACAAASAGVNVAAKGECGAAGNLQWFQTCGDPVCSGYKPKPGVKACSGDEKEGLSCQPEDAVCDPKDACNALLTCTDKDPKQQPGGCPISRAAFKTGVAYLDVAAQEALAQRLLATRLATYRYKAQGPTGRRHLGFLIDDDPQSPAVDAQRDMVDLYGYLSMAVATLQTQQRTIEALRQEAQALRAEVQALQRDRGVGVAKAKASR